MIFRGPVRLELDVEGLSSLHLNSFHVVSVPPTKIVFCVVALYFEKEIHIVPVHVGVIAMTIASELRVVGVCADIDRLVDFGGDRDVLDVCFRCVDLEGSVVRMMVRVDVRVCGAVVEGLIEIFERDVPYAVVAVNEVNFLLELLAPIP